MPVPNDLTAEEEAEFGQHGVAPAGPGREPLSEKPPEQQAQEQQVEVHQPAEESGRKTFHRDDGKFASREEVEAGQAKPSGQEPGQEQAQEPGQEEPPKMVPLAALHQERAARSELARRVQLAEARMNAMLTRAPEREAPEMPDINQDPAGYIVALEKRLEQFESARNQDTQTRQIDQAISMDEDTFRNIQPDYDQASDHYVQSRARELINFYPPEEAQRILLGEARQIAQEAWQRGKSVGEIVYGLARARGYNPETAATERRVAASAGPKATDVVESITRGQSASRSMSGAPGMTAEQLNADALLKMSDDEFAAWLGEGNAATRKFATVA